MKTINLLVWAIQMPSMDNLCRIGLSLKIQISTTKSKEQLRVNVDIVFEKQVSLHK